MKPEVEKIIKAYGLDKPVEPDMLSNHVYLVARETATNIVHLLSEGGKSKAKISSKSISFLEAIEKLRDRANKALGWDRFDDKK